MEKKLTKAQKDYIIRLIQDDKSLPDEFKYLLFPCRQNEYELVYAWKIRKEDLIANEDGVFPVPLQVDKIFNGEEHKLSDNSWRNMIIFGDNLQFLKTIYENKDPLIKDKIKGKIKLIYIDPPFATEGDLKGKKGARAYSDKTKGSEFVEFLRRRLILARELLSDNGSIFVHLDNRQNHYIKILLDEIFGEHNFLNQITWLRSSSGKTVSKNFSKDTDYLLWYSKTENYFFSPTFQPLSAKTIDMYKKDDDDGRGKYRLFPLQKTGNPGPETTYDYIDNNKKVWKCPSKGWRMKYEKLKALENDNRLCLDGDSLQEKAYWNERDNEGKIANNLWNDIPNLQGANTEIIDYPTQKPEKLLERILLTCTNKGDLVMDFFAGSGTTASVAEKLERRWVTCDIGKLSCYTMQKRILTIQDSKRLGDTKKKYGKKSRSFITAQLGLYDLGKVFDLQEAKYKEFVMGLFEVEALKNQKIGGFAVDGKKGEYFVKIFQHWKFKGSSVDEAYLKNIHSVIGRKISGRFYIIAPANYVDFLTDYHEIYGIRYYFLKIPYQVIRELHKTPFQKLKQPQSKKKVNDLEETIGFHFIRQPEVKSKLINKGSKIEIRIDEFKSHYYKGEEGEVLGNFETIAMVLIDTSYDNKEFIMEKVYFADELLAKKPKDEENEDQIRKVLKRQKSISIVLDKKEIDKKMLIVYVDIYGNEFKEILTIKG
jgi:site-specific DNA-methyltransferase (adenine-specific)/adenine-specific DNA-methyltransferase